VPEATQTENVAVLPRASPQSTSKAGSWNGRLRRLFRSWGPGLITGASDDDPSGIATYSQVGAQFGFSITWTLLFTYPLMAVIQEISARIGRTTGCGVAANIARHCPNWILQTLGCCCSPTS
jgi:Mn2+/Fe2+ NRAMP family transporter